MSQVQKSTMEQIISKEVVELEAYINKTWPKFTTQKEMALRDLFPEPENRGLKHIWKYGTTDLVVYRSSVPICILEPGGSHHFEKKQMKNDARKFKLAELNNCTCLHLMNKVISNLSKCKLRKLIGGYLWKKLK